MNNKIKLTELKVGDIFNISTGGTITIGEIRNYREIIIQHNDSYGHIASVRLSHILTGNVFNPYRPSVRDRGYIGVGKYQSSVNGRNTKEYDAWRHMFTRCYSEVYHLKNPVYIGCEVTSSWWNFQVFAEWYCNTGYYDTDYQVDKDLLIYANRLYSSGTCCVIPIDINSAIQDKRFNRSLPTGVYKRGNRYIAQVSNALTKSYIGMYETAEEASQHYIQAKRKHIKYLADTWREKIAPEAYAALIKYITYL